MNLTWEEKLSALKTLGDVSLKMREPGNWYVEQPRVEVRRDVFLEGRYGNGRTPEEAVCSHWKNLTDLPGDEWIVVDAMRSSRRAYRWTTFMWTEIPESGR